MITTANPLRSCQCGRQAVMTSGKFIIHPSPRRIIRNTVRTATNCANPLDANWFASAMWSQQLPWNARHIVCADVYQRRQMTRDAEPTSGAMCVPSLHRGFVAPRSTDVRRCLLFRCASDAWSSRISLRQATNRSSLCFGQCSRGGQAWHVAVYRGR